MNYVNHDRLVAGGVAGFIAAIISNIYGLTTKALGLTDRTFVDFAKVLIMYKPYPGILGYMVGEIAILTVGIFWGVAYAYIIKMTSSRFNLLKGWGYGIILWMLLSGFGTIFDLPLFKDIPPYAAINNFIESSIYGLVTAFGLNILDKETKLL